MSRIFTAALVAAMVAGAVVAATAIGESDEEQTRAGSPRTKLVAPTRAQAIEAAAALRTRVNEELARRLGVPADRLLAAERALVDRQLAQAIDHGLLTAEQRDALLACFDNPTGCDRGGLPVQRGTYIGQFPSSVVLRPCGRRGRCIMPKAPFGTADALAKQLSLPRRTVAAAVRAALRKLGPGQDARDPDGVPLGPDFVFGPFVPGSVVLTPEPRPVPARP